MIYQTPIRLMSDTVADIKMTASEADQLTGDALFVQI